MARDWRKYEYNRQLFGEKVLECRLSLGWSLGQLSRVISINRGTLKQVEEGRRSLPEDDRRKLVEKLIELLASVGVPISRRDFFKLAGLVTSSTILNISPLYTQPIEMCSKRIAEDKTHEEYAEILAQQEELQQAANFFLLAAREASIHGDWVTWARCTTGAGQMALERGQFEVAESRFKEVLARTEDEVGRVAIWQAYFRLGWLRDEQYNFNQASRFLEKAQALLQSYEDMNALEEAVLHFLGPRAGLSCAVGPCGEALQESTLHFLGRTYGDWGIMENDQRLLSRGQVILQKAHEYRRKHGLIGENMGFNLLRQIPILLCEGETKIAEVLLEQTVDLLGDRGRMIGHIYLHRGLLALEEKPRSARELFEKASEGYREPFFYPKGLSEVLMRISETYPIDNRKTNNQLELEYALAATFLHPYGRNLDVLRWAAYRTYRQLGESIRVFNIYMQELEEKVWAMEGPFSDLKRLVESFGFEHGMQHLETAIQRAKKAINAELPS